MLIACMWSILDDSPVSGVSCQGMSNCNHGQNLDQSNILLEMLSNNLCALLNGGLEIWLLT